MSWKRLSFTVMWLAAISSVSVFAQGNVAVSVAIAEACVSDSLAGGIGASLLLGSEIRGEVEQPGYYFLSDEPKVRSDLDLLMLTQGWRRYSMDSIVYGATACVPPVFETEQTISGRVVGTFRKIKDPQLSVLIPLTGYSSLLELGDNVSFDISGLDFVDGTTILLQALNRKGSDAFFELKVDDKEYPSLSMGGGHGSKSNVLSSVISRDWQNIKMPSGRLSDIQELPDVEVTGRKIRPMNRMSAQPDRGFGENDPALELSHNMEMLISRLGLIVGTAVIETDEEDIQVRSIGRYVMSKFVPNRRFIAVGVYLNDDLVTGYALEDILSLEPSNVRQIEYFLPSNHEVSGNLDDVYGKTESGLLMIWTKSPVHFSRFRINKPLSMVTVRQLGYKPPVEFYVPRRDAALSRPTVYWNPCVPLGVDGKIRLDLPQLDATRRYVITVEGVNNDGSVIGERILKE